MRGVMLVFGMVIILITYMLFAPAAIEGVGEGVKDTGMLDDDEEAIIDDIYTALFVRIPIVLIFGFLGIGVAWYIRRQSTVGRI